MKAVHFIFLLIAVLLSSCSNGGISIEGIIEEGDYNGKTMHLFYPSPTTGYSAFEELARVSIENNKFIFDLELDEGFENELPMIGYLTMFDMNAALEEGDEGKNELIADTPIATFILENGNIQVKLENTSVSLSGTQNNNEFNNVHIAIKDLVDFASKVESYTDLNEIPLDDQGRDGRAQFQEKNDRLSELTYKFTEKNMKNNVGQFLFLRSYTDNLFTPTQLLSLIEKGTQEFKKREDVSWLSGVLEQMNSANHDDITNN